MYNLAILNKLVNKEVQNAYGRYRFRWSFDFEQMLNESFEQSENNSVVDGVIVDINAERVLS